MIASAQSTLNCGVGLKLLIVESNAIHGMQYVSVKIKNFFFALIISTVFCSSSAYADTVRVGILKDGPELLFSTLQDLFTQEVLDLTEGEFEVVFPDSKNLHGNWSTQDIEAAFSDLQNDREVDMVLALGFVASLVASSSDNIKKPTFAPLVLDGQLAGLARDGNTSGVENLNYLTEEIRFPEDLNYFREITEFEELILLVDEIIFESVPELAAEGKIWAQDLGINLQYVLHNHDVDDLISEIPREAEAVMVAALPRLDSAGRQKLIEGLNKRKLPSYSLIGTTPVAQGILAAAAPDSDWQRLARRNALNMQAVMLGESAGDQPVSFQYKRKLTINMETARILDIYPRFDILSEAVLLNEDIVGHDITWSLSGVAHEALKSNLDLRVSETGLEIGDEVVNETESLLRPQFNTSLNAVQLDNSNPGVVAGQSAERTISAALNLTQTIYSEANLAAIEIQHYTQEVRQAAHRALELDVVRDATVGFLNILKAKSFLNIQRRALELSRTNLDQARDRVNIGTTNASDVYRWESEVATTRQSLLAAQAQYNQSQDALNKLLHRPISERFETVPASLNDSSLLISRSDLVDIINNQKKFDLMGDFMINEGIRNAPELKQIKLQQASTERQLVSEERSYWRPVVSLNGQVSHTLDEHETLMNSREGETDWQISLNLTLPLYQGGARKSRISQNQLTLTQLNYQLANARDSIEQGIRANLHAVQSTFPSIELAQVAAEAARKNLDLIQDNYNRGTVTIIELLDARDASLNADLSANDAIYNFLIDLMNLQRSTAGFDFFLDQASLDALAEKLKSRVSL